MGNRELDPVLPLFSPSRQRSYCFDCRLNTVLLNTVDKKSSTKALEASFQTSSRKATVEFLELPASLQISSNTAENWRQFRQRSELYLAAIRAGEKPDKVKSSLLLHMAGKAAPEIYNNFQFCGRRTDEI